MSVKTGIVWQVPPSVLGANVGERRAKMRPTLQKNMSSLAGELQRWAKANHRWRNRTGAAEARFTVVVEHGGLRLVAKHGVFYGVYLEFKHGGRWGVIRDLLAYARGPCKRAMDATVREVLA